MFKKNDVSNPGSFDSLIGANAVFNGSIESEGTIRVDGKITGDLKINGDVIIGTNAVVKGDVYAKNVHISGMVEGNVDSEGILRLFSTAKLYGDIQVHSFVADEGGVFHGKCSMVEAPKPEEVVEEKLTLKKPKDYKKSSALNQMEEKEKIIENLD